MSEQKEERFELRLLRWLEPPQPPFGHLLPVGEKGRIDRAPTCEHVGGDDLLKAPQRLPHG
jgi:hypothetical protein